GERKLIQPGFPGGGALRLSGLPARRRRRTRSPGKRSAAGEEAAPMYLSPYIPGLRRKRLTRATGPQTAVDP
ncbi:hypothetical protein, partial [Klebsiella michiganensis]|uniref:hypothetical protein n=1 Tax=Klebsiella michiganensis TaxID=1134687 RepID=UPI0039C07C7E